MHLDYYRRLAPTAILIGLILPAFAWGLEGRYERTLTVTGPVDLSVSSASGTITVRTGEAVEVRVYGTIKASNMWLGSDLAVEKKIRNLESNPPIEQHGNIIKIGRIDDPELRRGVSINYEVVVPVETQLRTDGGSGDQRIDGIRGPLKAQTGSGGLRISNIGDTVHASTGSGNIEISSAKGSVHASSGSGAIQATGVAASFSASTGSGDVRLEQVAGGEVKITTGSGDIEARGVRGSLHANSASGSIFAEGAPEATWKLEAASGDVTVRLPTTTGVDVRAKTASGAIHTAREMALAGTTSANELQGKIGSGGPALELRTASGSIRIE